MYQQLDFHRNVSETILAYGTDIPCKYSVARLNPPSTLHPHKTLHAGRRNKNIKENNIVEKYTQNKAPIN